MGELFDATIKVAFLSKLKPETQIKYMAIINEASHYCGKSFEDINVEDARSFDKFLCDREEKGEIKHSTHVAHISVLRSLGDFISRCNFFDDYTNPFASVLVKAVDENLSSSDLPSMEDVEKLLSACTDRDKLIFSLSAKCGLSTSEICSLKESDVFLDVDGNLCGVSVRKGRYCRNIKLPDDVLVLLENYLSLGVTEHLFINRRNNPIQPRDLQRLLQKYLTELGMPSRFTIEDLRHCAIVYMKAGGAADNDIADYLGVACAGRIGNRYKKVAYEDMYMAADNSLLKALVDDVAGRVSAKD